MPLLVGFFDPAAEAPGFVLPLFKFDRGSNAILVQRIDINDRVIGFDDFDPPVFSLEYAATSMILNVGDNAIWAFKHAMGKIYLGDAKELGSIASDFIKSKELEKWPLIRLELEAFRQPGRADPDIIRAAFQDISEKSGELAAEVWRDTELLAPAFRRDAKKHLPGEVNSVRLQSSIVLCRRALNIFVDPAIERTCHSIELEETRYILRVFNLPDSILIKAFSSSGLNVERNSSWRVRGIGGVARFVLGRVPFRGFVYRFGSVEKEVGIEASGILPGGKVGHRSDSQFIAVCQSTFDHFLTMKQEVENFSPSIFLRHLINVRPFNFGSLPARRVSLSEVQVLAAGFDHIWVIGGHRQKKTGNYRNQLSITNAASRLTKNALISIINNHKLILDISDELPHSPSINTFGFARIFKESEGVSLYRRLLHSMLDEEVLLHSAKRIIFLSPTEIRSRVEKLTLGERTYIIDIVPSGRVKKVNNIVGWALSVTPRRNSSEEFQDFCISIFSGYVETRRERDEHIMIIGSEGRRVIIQTAHSNSALQEIIDHFQENYGQVKNIVIRDRIDKIAAVRAKDLDLNIFHYSEIPSWLKMVIN